MGQHVQEAKNEDELKLANGTNVVADGTNVIADGINVVADRTNVVADGINVVADGTNVVIKESNGVGEPILANGTYLNHYENKSPVTGTEEVVENGAGCCQGANGFSCCRVESVEQKPAKDGPSGPSCWIGRWEQHHVLTAVAVVGAVLLLLLLMASTEE